MKLDTVTITGADDSVNPEDLVALSEKFPFVEWGILLSRSQMGGKRFPSAKWMDSLLLQVDKLKLAGHLCGSWLNNLMNFNQHEFIDELSLWEHFKRVQLNFHGEKFDINPDTLQTLRNQTWKHSKKFIVQMDNINNELYERLNHAGVLAQGLFDLSHGTGVLPEEWPEVVPSMNPKAYRGYAGGLGANNLEDQLQKIATAVGDIYIWIDMETQVRSNNDLQFDLEKVEKCLEISSKYVVMD